MAWHASAAAAREHGESNRTEKEVRNLSKMWNRFFSRTVNST
jgi:hypothetical protein